MAVSVAWFAPFAAAAEDPFARAEAAKVGSSSLFQKPLFTISDGDFVLPRISPDGKFLAYADTFVREGVEGTAVYVRDLRSGETRSLLSPEITKRYQVYKVFVFDIEWLDGSRVEVALSDGDVGSTRIILDARTGVALSASSNDGGDFPTDPKPPSHLEPLKAKILAAFPAWDAEVLGSTLMNRPVLVPGGGAVLQKNYADVDHDVWFVDPDRKVETRLLSMGKKDIHAMGGGLAIDGDALFAVSHDGSVYLFALKPKGELQPLAQFVKKQWRAWMEVRTSIGSEALFMLKLFEPYEYGHNPVFAYSPQSGLSELSDCRNCYDFDVSKNADLAVFAHWVNGRRELKVLGRTK